MNLLALTAVGLATATLAACGGSSPSASALAHKITGCGQVAAGTPAASCSEALV
jgi:hypothetical protein